MEIENYHMKYSLSIAVHWNQAIRVQSLHIIMRLLHLEWLGLFDYFGLLDLPSPFS